MAVPGHVPLLGDPLELRSQVEFLGLPAIKKSVADVVELIKIVNERHFFSHLMPIQGDGVDLVEEVVVSSVLLLQLMQVLLQFLANSDFVLLHLLLKNVLLVCHNSQLLALLLLLIFRLQVILQSTDLSIQFDLLCF